MFLSLLTCRVNNAVTYSDLCILISSVLCLKDIVLRITLCSV